MGIHMVEVGDIIEIQDGMFTKGGVSLFGRRYEVKKKIGRAIIPELRATPLSEAHKDYNPQGDGSTWESAGISHKGRPNAIPKSSYNVFRAAEEKEGAAPSDEAKDEKPEAAPASSASTLKSSKPKSVAQLVAKAAKPFRTIGNRTNNLLESFVNDRELNYEKMLPSVQFSERDGMNFKARVIFSAPIDYADPQSYTDEADFQKKVISSATAKKKQIIRQYQIGKEVTDIIGNKEGALNCYIGGVSWNKPTNCLGLSIVLSEDDCLPHLVAHLETQDEKKKKFYLTHRLQAGIVLTPPKSEKVEEADESPFGGLPTQGTKTEQGFGMTELGGEDWTSLIDIPCLTEDNDFPSTSGASASMPDIRAVLGITFDHDDPALKNYEKDYVVDWNIQPSIMAGSESNGFVEAQFEVHDPPEGQPTDRLPGANRHWLRTKEENPQGIDPKGWKPYPRLVRVILPGADSSFMDIPVEGKTLDEARADTENSMLSKVHEVRYYTHPPKATDGKLRELRLTQTKEKRSMEGIKELSLHAVWKVGDDYEFRTKVMGEGNQWQNFKGRLLRIVVNTEASRENAYNSAVEARRNMRLFATKETNTSDIFFVKDSEHPNSFVVALKNANDEAFTGQIIRINLAAGESND